MKISDTAVKKGTVFWVFAGLALLLGCGTTGKGSPGTTSPEQSTSTGVEVEADKGRLAKSAQTPLYDLNLKRDEIPAALETIKVVYASPSDGACATVTDEITGLNAILGPDPGLAELRRDMEADETESSAYKFRASDALEGTISGFVPYSGIIRRLSGAQKHKNRLATVIIRGQLRRAYLMGIVQEKGCSWPASWQENPEAGKP